MTDIEVLLQGQRLRADSVPQSQRLAICFVLAMLAMLPAQFYRLGQTEALPWLLADYAGRIAALAVIVILPAGRWCLRQRDDLKVGTLEAALWVAAIAMLFRLAPIDSYLFSLFPQLPLGEYPAPKGVLYAFDITLGLALVALHEELVFRKLGGQVFAALGWGTWRTILVTGLLFGLYHWWRAPAGIIAAALYGVIAMICYRRTGSLWPVGFAHYLVDYFAFA